MKCALCGGNWADRPPYEKLLTHPQNDCCLSPIADITETEVNAINAAIRQAREEGEKHLKSIIEHVLEGDMVSMPEGVSVVSTADYEEFVDWKEAQKPRPIADSINSQCENRNHAGLMTLARQIKNGEPVWPSKCGQDVALLAMVIHERWERDGERCKHRRKCIIKDFENDPCPCAAFQPRERKEKV